MKENTDAVATIWGVNQFLVKTLHDFAQLGGAFASPHPSAQRL